MPLRGWRLEENVGPNNDVLAARRIFSCGGIDAGGVERPPRDGSVGDGVVALQHRDLIALLLRKPVPIVIGTVGKARRLADAVIVGTVVGDIWLVGKRRPCA